MRRSPKGGVDWTPGTGGHHLGEPPPPSGQDGQLQRAACTSRTEEETSYGELTRRVLIPGVADMYVIGNLSAHERATLQSVVENRDGTIPVRVRSDDVVVDIGDSVFDAYGDQLFAG
ncbi:hypothetical protein Pmar_PMAR020870 [Perkinsus marinus ATCC 50983]|uniref:Uncharacterized protein n=1 Tax=Perkinsus marinus (strain ATCC 50983 / TXsc) TaxID=423536 RepID=C5KN54_PERM5|nr:hypothetical protein Pmar_PMAR020870 [Perkinsus marinus ATCC 50983]EER14088.1 hypothetical protein Pmar_PMAR020870 [Perkinsus marinus ATCC 50983]|eukprot:XP_002782293.1 hypothetical protein Pmar_PMAR020870 [Perkinsus marinus ATCC 50983]